jgi:ankyrin repeat protein
MAAASADAALLRAAKAGDADAVREALWAGARVACVDSYGATPLHWAVRAPEDTAAAKALIEAGASLEARTLEGKLTPLLWAAGNKRPAAVTLLLAAGSDSGTVCKDGFNALHCAAVYGGGHLGCAQAVLAGVGAGADVLRVGRSALGQLPLELVVGTSAEAEALRALLRSPAADAALLSALQQRSAEAVARALDQGASASLPLLEGEPPLQCAAFFDACECIELLVAWGAPLEERGAKTGGTALHTAAINGNLKAAKLLVRLGADTGALDARGLTPDQVAKTTGVSGDVGAALRTAADSASLTALLRSLGLEEYETKLRNFGAETLADAAKYLKDSDLVAFGVKPLQRRALLAALAAPTAPRAAAQQPASVAETISRPSSKAPADVMISYRVPESGLAGDSAVVELKKFLEMRGYTVFVGESSIEGGDEWASTIQAAVVGCKAFVVVCSRTYGDEMVSTWTWREFQLADKLKKLILPVWHSGPYPPEAVQIFLSGTQRVPNSNITVGYVAAGISQEAVAAELARTMALKGVLPSQAPQT